MIFNLQAYTAVSTGLITYDQWLNWASGENKLPDYADKLVSKNIPASIRRRCSSVARASLATIFTLVNDKKLPIVYASRHGEADTTLKLLEELARQEEPSPNSFTMSVHNTPCGLASLTSGNKSTAIAVAAGENSLLAGFLEASAQLQIYPEVILVFTDFPLPEIFKEKLMEDSPFISLAFRLTKAKGSAELKIDFNATETAKLDNSVINYFLRFLFSKQTQIQCNHCLWFKSGDFTGTFTEVPFE